MPDRPFTGMRLDRASDERKDPATVQRLLADPSSLVVSAGDGGVLLDAGGDSLLREPVRGGLEPILLGLEDGRAVFAADVPDGDRLVPLRDAVARLPQAEGGLASYVTALLGWHRRHRFCANCGSPTDVIEAGYSRHCPNCGAHHFPRTDPVVIMTVEHEGRLLLGRRAGWPSGRVSVLAGFISPGESAEEAVTREVAEEAGIRARDPVYVTSQPWPFPASLMLGFDARSDGGEPVARDGELEEVGWFDLDAVRGAAREERLPPPISIARCLIDRWLARHGDG